MPLRGGEATGSSALYSAKAVDSVSPEALHTVLKRFGVPQDFIEMARAISYEQSIVVSDGGMDPWRLASVWDALRHPSRSS